MALVILANPGTLSAASGAALAIGETIAAGGTTGLAVSGAASGAVGAAVGTSVTAATGCAITGGALGGAAGAVAGSAGFWAGLGAALTGPVGLAILGGALLVTGGTAQEIDSHLTSDPLNEGNDLGSFDLADNLDAAIDFAAQ